MIRGYRVNPMLWVLIAGFALNTLAFAMTHGLFSLLMQGVFTYIIASRWDLLVERIKVQ